MLRRAMYGGRLVEHNGLVLGVNMGVDPCAEHEWGIKGIQQAFGLNLERLVGYEARKITKLPKDVHSGQSEKTKGAYLVYDSGLGMGHPEFKNQGIVWGPPTPEKIKERIERLLESELAMRSREFVTAWDSSEFGIHGNSAQYGQAISDLSDAFLQEDVVIDGSSDLHRPGFSLLIYSRIPEELKEKFRREDEIKRKAKSD